MKKVSYILVSILIISLILTSCQTTPQPTEVTSVDQPKMEQEPKGRVLTLMSEETSPESQAFYRKAATDFEKINPGVSIILDFPASAADALPIRIAAGSPPDITTMQLEAQLYYADLGLLEPADWWFEKHGDDVVPNASVPYKDPLLGNTLCINL